MRRRNAQRHGGHLLYPDPKGLAWTRGRHGPGSKVIFPSQVRHDVEPFRGEEERFTIACDCWLTLLE